MKLLALVVALATLLVIGSLALVAFAGGKAGYVAVAVGAGVTAGLLFLLAIPFWIVFLVAVLIAVRASTDADATGTRRARLPPGPGRQITRRWRWPTSNR